MKVTWLGQAGLLFETADGHTVMVDPYLSDSVEKIEPHNRRRVPVEERFFEVKPDVIVLTHNHLDHTDPETLAHYLTDHSRVTVLAPANAWKTVRERFNGVSNNFVLFNRGTEWSECGVRFTAVAAEHSDPTAVGVLLEAEGRCWYVTGDTLYNRALFADLPSRVDYVFLPVNGRGNNMNMTDACRFCEQIGATAVPLHCGLFDETDMNRFAYEKKVVPTFYREISL